MARPSSARRPLARSSAPEAELTKAGLLAVAVAAIPLIGGSWALAGADAAAGALAATSLVAGMLAASGLLLAMLTRRSPALLGGGALVGVAVRWVLYVLAFGALAQIPGIDRRATALSLVILLVITLAYEVRYVATRPGFYWLRNDERTGV